MTDTNPSEELVIARNRLTALKATKAATEAYSEWSFWNAAYDLLGPTGLRLQATIAALKELNPRIAKVAADLFPEHQVNIVELPDGAGVSLRFDDMSYGMLVWDGDPNSYALRIKILFQILEAQRLGNGAFILIDRFDTLEKTHKNGVFQALIKTGVQAIIGQMANEKPEKDLLAAADVGKTFWINNGTVEAVVK